MRSDVTRRMMLAGLAGTLGHAALAGAPASSLRPKLRADGEFGVEAPVRPEPRPETLRGPAVQSLETLIAKADLGGMLSLCVRDLKSGRVLESMNPDLTLPPASVAKSVTAAYARDVLGPDHRFETHLVATGPIKDGIVQGDLLLVGGGDPELDTDALAAMVAGLKAKGVRGASGQLRGWGGAIPALSELNAEQPVQVAYNPAISGLNLNFNRVHFEWARTGANYRLSMDARSDTLQPPVRTARISASTDQGPVYVYSDGGTYDSWSVARRALGKAGSRWLPMRKPVRYANEVFVWLAKQAGIDLTAGEPVTDDPQGRVLVTHFSDPLDDILRNMLKYSTNLTAELCGQAATRARLGALTDLRASAREMSRWAEGTLGMTGVEFADHSGLSALTLINAETLSRAYVAPAARAIRPLLKPVAMRDTNYKLLKDHPLQVLAKTGTLFFVSCLGGYIRTPTGRELSFAILCANEKEREDLNPALEDAPAGALAWNKRAKLLQQGLLQRWGGLYDT